MVDPSSLVLVGVLLSAIGALWGAAGDTGRWFTKPPALVFLGVLLSAVGVFSGASREASSERELRAKSEEIAQLSRNTLNMFIGGDSFLYLTIVGGASGPKNTTRLVAVHEGEYLLHEVEAAITDLDKFEALTGPATFQALETAQKHIQIGNLIPRTSRILQQFEMGAGDYKRYNIFFSARNGLWTELLRLQRVDGQWRTAIRVTRDVFPPSDSPDQRLTSEVIFEKVDPKYPRNDAGEIVW